MNAKHVIIGAGLLLVSTIQIPSVALANECVSEIAPIFGGISKAA